MDLGHPSRASGLNGRGDEPYQALADMVETELQKHLAADTTIREGGILLTYKTYETAETSTQDRQS